jgi:hypothetical protein
MILKVPCCDNNYSPLIVMLQDLYITGPSKKCIDTTQRVQLLLHERNSLVEQLEQQHKFLEKNAKHLQRIDGLKNKMIVTSL